MHEWIDITTLEQSFRYVVEMDINSDKTRYRKKYAKDVVGDWIYGELKQKGETNENINE